MTHDATIATLNRTEKAVRATGLEQVVQTSKVKADQGILEAGLLLAWDGDGTLVPYAETENEVIGTGTGVLKNFYAVLANAPIEPGTVTVTDGVETFTDCMGNMISDTAEGDPGYIDYETGKIHVEFSEAVADETPVTATYHNQLAGVLDRPVDPAKTTAALRIVHGAVNQNALVKGSDGPDTEDLRRLGDHHIWAV